MAPMSKHIHGLCRAGSLFSDTPPLLRRQGCTAFVSRTRLQLRWLSYARLGSSCVRCQRWRGAERLQNVVVPPASDTLGVDRTECSVKKNCPSGAVPRGIHSNSPSFPSEHRQGSTETSSSRRSENSGHARGRFNTESGTARKHRGFSAVVDISREGCCLAPAEVLLARPSLPPKQRPRQSGLSFSI